LDRRLGPPAERMVARSSVPEILPEVREHRLEHARVERGRGMVIHVDRKAHSVRAAHLPTLAYQCGPVRSIITTGDPTSRWKPAAPRVFPARTLERTSVHDNADLDTCGVALRPGGRGGARPGVPSGPVAHRPLGQPRRRRRARIWTAGRRSAPGLS